MGYEIHGVPCRCGEFELAKDVTCDCWLFWGGELFLAITIYVCNQLDL